MVEDFMLQFANVHHNFLLELVWELDRLESHAALEAISIYVPKSIIALLNLHHMWPSQQDPLALQEPLFSVLKSWKLHVLNLHILYNLEN